MSQSTFGKKFTVTTWGESHGKALGTVVDGVPAGLFLTEADIQTYLDRRKPGQSRYTTARNEGDEVEILPGITEISRRPIALDMQILVLTVNMVFATTEAADVPLDVRPSAELPPEPLQPGF